MNIGLFILWIDYWINKQNHYSVNEFIHSLGEERLTWLNCNSSSIEYHYTITHYVWASCGMMDEKKKVEYIFVIFDWSCTLYANFVHLSANWTLAGKNKN